MAFSSSSDGIVYVTGADHQVVALDAATGEVKGKFGASKYPLSCLVIAPGLHLLSAKQRSYGGLLDYRYQSLGACVSCMPPCTARAAVHASIASPHACRQRDCLWWRLEPGHVGPALRGAQGQVHRAPGTAPNPLFVFSYRYDFTY